MTTSSITLGLAAPGDASTLAQMARDYIEAGLGWSYQPRRIGQLIRDPDVTTLVARDAGCIVGFAIMSFGDDRAHLVLLAVHPSRRRRGIGRRMLDWLVESATTAGTSSIHVELRADNAPAYAMYEAAGFAETFRVPRYYRGRETAVRMLRVLRAPGVTAPAWQPPASR
jgi:[ribosomal protein S18]-alanine N-acetyltransferase